MPEMTQDEAFAKAKELWGKDAWVMRYKLGGPVRDEFCVGGDNLCQRGVGDSWEAAFLNAAERSSIPHA